MSEFGEETPQPQLIKESKRPHIQKLVEEEETRIEDEAPSTDKFKTNQELPRLNAEARKRVAAQIWLERQKKQTEKEREEKFTDGLTGLKNRLWFDQELQKQVQNANDSSRANLWLLFFDIDHFKWINSEYGHTGGDTILKLITKITREGETVARYGGEEFAQFLNLNDFRNEGKNLTDQEKIEAIMQRYSSQMKGLSESVITELEPVEQVPPEEHLNRTTLSFGAVRYIPGEDPIDFVRRASASALLAKAQGRDRGIINFQSDMSHQNITISLAA